MYEITTDHGLPRVVIEADSKLAADEIREQWGDAVVEGDDARRKRVTLSGDIRDQWRYAIEHLGDVEEPPSYGQRALTAFERSQIDFTETNVFHARSCKAIARGKDVDDWLGHYDPKLTVDEHREVYERAAGRAETMREMATEQFRPAVAVAVPEVSAGV
jgi:hypothetical protein